MNRGTRLVLAFGVLLAGIALALLFRRPSPRTDPPTPGVSERLVLRKQIGAEADLAPQAESPLGRTAVPADPAPRTAPGPRKVAKVLTPMGPGKPPPSLARTYPHPPPGEGSRWGTSVGIGPPEPDPQGPGPQTHRIVDGDTLEGLARRYLGSVDRAAEIYRANRDVLARPDLLPIGAELKIPPSSPPEATPQRASLETLRRQPLVPIPPRP